MDWCPRLRLGVCVRVSGQGVRWRKRVRREGGGRRNEKGRCQERGEGGRRRESKELKLTNKRIKLPILIPIHKQQHSNRLRSNRPQVKRYTHVHSARHIQRYHSPEEPHSCAFEAQTGTTTTTFRSLPASIVKVGEMPPHAFGVETAFCEGAADGIDVEV